MIVYKAWIEIYVSFVFGYGLSVSDDHFEARIDSNESTEGAIYDSMREKSLSSEFIWRLL